MVCGPYTLPTIETSTNWRDCVPDGSFPVSRNIADVLVLKSQVFFSRVIPALQLKEFKPGHNSIPLSLEDYSRAHYGDSVYDFVHLTNKKGLHLTLVPQLPSKTVS